MTRGRALRARRTFVAPIVCVALSAVLGTSPATGQEGEGGAGVAVETRERFYVLDNAMRLQGPGAPPSQGLTDWRIRPRWRPAASDGRCRVSALRLHVDIVVTLPRWANVGRATPTERERWDRIEASIRDHEHGHRDLTIDAAGELFAKLSSLEAGGCVALRRAFEGEMSLAEARIEEVHDELDRATPRRLIGGS